MRNDARSETETHTAIKLASHMSQKIVFYNANIEKTLVNCMKGRVVASIPPPANINTLASAVLHSSSSGGEFPMQNVVLLP